MNGYNGLSLHRTKKILMELIFVWNQNSIYLTEMFTQEVGADHRMMALD